MCALPDFFHCTQSAWPLLLLLLLPALHECGAQRSGAAERGLFGVSALHAERRGGEAVEVKVVVVVVVAAVVRRGFEGVAGSAAGSPQTVCEARGEEGWRERGKAARESA